MGEKRNAIIAKRERILADWAECWPADLIGERQECSASNVHRIIREYGDPNHPNRTERAVEMKRVEKFADVIVKLYNEGGSVEQIAGQLGLQAREVRAAVYLAIQRGEIRAYQNGARQ